MLKNKVYLPGGCLCIIIVFVNLVSCADGVEPMWHSYQFGTGHGNREELVISGVEANKDFYSGDEEVLRWKSITSGGRTYAAGLRRTGVIAITVERRNKYFDIYQKELSGFVLPVADFDLFEHWNETSRQGDVVLVVATTGSTPKLMWFTIIIELVRPSIDLDTYLFDNHFWVWYIHTNVSHLRYIKLEDGKDRLLIINQDEQGTSANLFEFTINDFNLRVTDNSFGLTQSFPLAIPANNTAINTFGSTVYLSIPQKNKVLVYKFKGNRFKPHQNISSVGVTQIISFKIGFKSFLAIGGKSAGIYKFTKKGIWREQIEGLNLDNVDLWFPVPISTYRDEILLIMQRIVFHESHKSYLVEAVVYDGRKFVALDEIRCVFFGEVEHGLACMVDEEKDGGLFGAALFNLDDTLAILIPRKGNSALFTVNWAIRNVENPVKIEVGKLADTRKKLQQMMDEQQSSMNDVQERLDKSIKLNESNTITAPWKLNTLSAPILKQNLQIPFPDENLELEKINIQELRNEAARIRKEIDNARNKLNFPNNVFLKAAEHRFNELVLNGKVEVRRESDIKSVIIEKFNDEPVSDAFNDLVRKGDINPISGHKTFTDLEVENLTFESINGVKIIDTSTPIVIKSHMLFNKSITILGDLNSNTGNVNDYDLSKEVVEMNKTYEDPLTFEHLSANVARAKNFPSQIKIANDGSDLSVMDNVDLEILRIPGNVKVENVNGENFEKFLKTLCFTNIKTHIPGETLLAGILNVSESAKVQTLNDLKFPDEYILRTSEFSEITGKKIFEGDIFANEIISETTVNGINTEDVLTLSKNQSLPGTFTFNDLEVTESLNVEGVITGPHIDNFLANPTLTESNLVKAKVNFKFLEVEGNVMISENYNENNFGEILNDVLYADEEEANIHSQKNFPAGFTVFNGVNIASNAINTIPIESFITKNTEQTIQFQSLNGPVSFENLLLGGLYGDVNITQFEQEVVKLTGEQFVSSTIIFNIDDEAGTDFSAVDFYLVNTLNDLPRRDYFFTTGPSRSLSSSLAFEVLHAENIFVEGEISGDLVNLPIKDFDARRLSYSRSQIVTAPYTVRNLDTDNIKGTFINGVDFTKLIDIPQYAKKISEMLFEGNLKIKNLSVNGSVSVDVINGQNAKELSRCYIWPDRDNNFNSVQFQRDVLINNLFLTNFNGVDFDLFVDNIIFKTDPNPTINGFKIFNKGFYVTRMLNSERLNEIHVDDILTKTGAQELQGPLNIHGNVFINNDCEIQGNLNDISVKYLSETYQIVGDTCIINENLVMGRLPYIEKLEVDGFANEENLEEFLKGMVYKTENTQILGKVTFGNTVQINQNIIVKQQLNNVDFSEFVQDMVFTTNDDVIEGSVTFTQPVYIEDELNIASNLEAPRVNGIALSDWEKRAMFVNRGAIAGRLKFESVTLRGNISLNYANDVDLRTLIPLYSDQYINQTLDFVELTPLSDVTVLQHVNGMQLGWEYPRTLLTNGDLQTVAQRMIFNGNVFVRDSIDIFGLVNGKNLNDVVTTNTAQNLNASYIFNELVVLEKGLILSGLINDINPSVWKVRSVRMHAERSQTVEDSWAVQGNITFEENVGGNGLIGGIDIFNMADATKKKRLFKFSVESKLRKDYDNICTEVTSVFKRAQNQICLFKYLENLQVLKFYNNIRNLHYFQLKNDSYILITESGSCMSHLFIWTKSQFQAIGLIETGRIVQIITVYDGDLAFLISRSDKISPDCPIQGTNVWKFELDNLNHLYKLEDQLDLQESYAPGVFYGLTENYVMEYKLITLVETNVKRYRKWNINEENLAFVPRGFSAGLALRNGYKLFRLLKEDPVIEDDFGYDTEVYIIGNVVEEVNSFLPGNGSDVLVINVGVEENKRSLVAVASHEETSVKGKLDFIKIYDDIITGKLFHKVPSYKPSSLVTLRFGTRGTLLIFLENEKTLQVYEYKGIEGFKHTLSAKLEGSKLIPMFLIMEPNRTERGVIGVINGNKVSFIQAVTTGNQIIMEPPTCEL